MLLDILEYMSKSSEYNYIKDRLSYWGTAATWISRIFQGKFIFFPFACHQLRFTYWLRRVVHWRNKAVSIYTHILVGIIYESGNSLVIRKSAKVKMIDICAWKQTLISQKNSESNKTMWYFRVPKYLYLERYTTQWFLTLAIWSNGSDMENNLLLS